MKGVRACKTYKSVCNLKFNKNILTPGEGVGVPQKHSVRTCHRCFTSGLGRAESVNFTHSKTTNSHPAPPLLFAYRSLLTTAIHDILCIYYDIYKTCVLLLIMYTFVHYTHTVVSSGTQTFSHLPLLLLLSLLFPLAAVTCICVSSLGIDRKQTLKR